MNNKLLVVLLVAALGVGLLGVGLALVGLNKTPAVVENVGAVPGPQISGNRFTVGGLTTYADSEKMSTASTTLCAMKLPNATSTLVRFSGNVTTPTSTPVFLLLEVSNTGFAPPLVAATTSGRDLITVATLSANVTRTLLYVGTSTPYVKAGSTTLEDNYVIAGRTATTSSNTTGSRYLILHARGNETVSQAGTGQVVAGNCKMELKEL